MVVRWNKSAVQDLHKIFLYIADHSPYYAKKVVSDIVEISEKLIEFPKLGKLVKGAVRAETREVSVYSYRLIYRIHKNVVRILVLVHSKRDFDLRK